MARLHSLVEFAHISCEARLVVLDTGGVDTTQNARHPVILIDLGTRERRKQNAVVSKALLRRQGQIGELAAVLLVKASLHAEAVARLPHASARVWSVRVHALGV